MIKINVGVKNSRDSHEVVLKTNDIEHSINIAPKSSGYGSTVNGGELLFLALATCYCNDIYREAAKRNIPIKSVQVEVTGEFNEAPGSRAENLTYHATIEAESSEQAILELMQHTDTVAEIQNSLRYGVEVKLTTIKAHSV